MTTPWSAADLAAVDASPELRIATVRRDGSWSSGTPVWVVRVGDDVVVRSWHRRSTGWFGRALRRPRARVDLPGLDAEVAVEDVGVGQGDLRERVDAAYRDKYGAGHASMVTDDAAATTLRLVRAQPRRPG